MLDANPILKNMYSADDDKTEVLYFEKAKAFTKKYAKGLDYKEYDEDWDFSGFD